jgi:hypothetical protein
MNKMFFHNETSFCSHWPNCVQFHTLNFDCYCVNPYHNMSSIFDNHHCFYSLLQALTTPTMLSSFALFLHPWIPRTHRSWSRREEFHPACILWGFSTVVSFVEWGCRPHAQPPTWRTRVSLFVWNFTLDLSGLGDPASRYATAGLALGFIGTRKPHHHKV